MNSAQGCWFRVSHYTLWARIRRYCAAIHGVKKVINDGCFGGYSVNGCSLGDKVLWDSFGIALVNSLLR